MPIVGSTGGSVIVTGGSGGGLTRALVGFAGGTVVSRGGTTGALLPQTERSVTAFIAGVDRSEYIEIGIKRTMTISGGSKSTCTFTINNHGRTTFRPAMGSAVVIYVKGVLFFGGVIDNTSEYDYSGSAGLNRITVNCVDYGALCDRRVVGRWIYGYTTDPDTGEQIPDGGKTYNAAMQILFGYLSDLGVTYVPDSTLDAMQLGNYKFNWVSLTEAANQIARDAGRTWVIDFFKYAYLIDPNFGYMSAPFDIAQNDQNWSEMHAQVDGSRYRNRVGVRNSQDLAAAKTDTFTSQPFQTQQQLTTGTDEGTYWWTNPETGQVEQDPLQFPPGDTQGLYDLQTVWVPPSIPPGTGVTVNHSDPISDVVWAEDTGEIATYGLREIVEEVKDYTDKTTLQTLADNLLAARLMRPITITYETFQDGLQPGMLQNVTLTRPLVGDEALLITQVSSEEQGKGQLWKHNVTATNQPVDGAGSGNDLAWAQKLAANKRQAKDRVTEKTTFVLAETIEGFDNPGLVSGTKGAVRVAAKPGRIRDVTLYFNSDDGGTITLNKNGSPIVTLTAGGRTVKRVTMPNTYVNKGDVFTVTVEGDVPGAHDGSLEIHIVG